MKPPKELPQLYHITRLENMPSILKYGLLSRKQVEKFGLLSVDIANHGILTKRENFQSPRPLPEYVPFHFFFLNPFDGDVCREYGSENMVIISIWRNWPPVLLFSRVIPIHPLDRSIPETYSYGEGFNKIDWDVLNLPIPQRDYHNDEIRHKCMAECLIPNGIAPEDFAYVYVHNPEAKAQIEKMPHFYRLKYPISVNRYMFP